MDSYSWQENEIALAYDTKFQILEAARIEYEQSIIALLREVKKSVEAKYPLNDLPDEIDLEIQLKQEDGFARQVLALRLKVNESPARVWIVCRLSSPWGGQPGFLQLGVVVVLDDKLVPYSIEALLKRSHEEGLWDQNGSDSIPTREEDTWVYGEKLPLTLPELAKVAAKRIKRFMAPASELALLVDQDYLFTKQMIEALEHARKKLGDLEPEWKFQPSSRLGWWEGMHFLQVDARGRPSYWVGFHVKRQCLMYGHSQWKDHPDFPGQFAERVGVRHTEKYGGNPAGVLFERGQIKGMTNDDLTGGIVSTFRIFVKTVQECV